MIVNLNQYRKKRRRAQADRRAADNRVRFGAARRNAAGTCARASVPKRRWTANVSINADDIGTGRTLSRSMTERIAVGVQACQIGPTGWMTCEPANGTRRRAEPLPVDIPLVFGIQARRPDGWRRQPRHRLAARHLRR